jgi:hypothetical protein
LGAVADCLLRRDAYEHIEDLALGLVPGKPHTDALSVFNFTRLFKEQVVSYASSDLDLGNETTQLLLDTRNI